MTTSPMVPSAGMKIHTTLTTTPHVPFGIRYFQGLQCSRRIKDPGSPPVAVEAGWDLERLTSSWYAAEEVQISSINTTLQELLLNCGSLKTDWMGGIKAFRGNEYSRQEFTEEYREEIIDVLLLASGYYSSKSSFTEENYLEETTTVIENHVANSARCTSGFQPDGCGYGRAGSLQPSEKTTVLGSLTHSTLVGTAVFEGVVTLEGGTSRLLL